MGQFAEKKKHAILCSCFLLKYVCVCYRTTRVRQLVVLSLGFQERTCYNFVHSRYGSDTVAGAAPVTHRPCDSNIIPL